MSNEDRTTEDDTSEVAELVGQGATNSAVARRTGLTLDTVKKYVSQILAQTGCHNRTELRC